MLSLGSGTLWTQTGGIDFKQEHEDNDHSYGPNSPETSWGAHVGTWPEKPRIMSLHGLQPDRSAALAAKF
jgi:hypothetical protein